MATVLTKKLSQRKVRCLTFSSPKERKRIAGNLDHLYSISIVIVVILVAVILIINLNYIKTQIHKFFGLFINIHHISIYFHPMHSNVFCHARHTLTNCTKRSCEMSKVRERLVEIYTRS